MLNSSNLLDFSEGPRGLILRYVLKCLPFAVSFVDIMLILVSLSLFAIVYSCESMVIIVVDTSVIVLCLGSFLPPSLAQHSFVALRVSARSHIYF